MKSVRVIVLSTALVVLLLSAACNTEVNLDNGGGSGPGVSACNLRGWDCADGFYCDQESGECLCDGTLEGACGEGNVCNVSTGECICGNDDCCTREGYVFDIGELACVCAADVCCPPDYYYDSASGSCLCSKDICCPGGYEVDEELVRCRCVSDNACQDGYFCHEDSGDCRCLNDDVCGEDRFCNANGFCQAQAACTRSLDCPRDHICDLNEGRCIADDCTDDLDCPINHICRSGACIDACRSSDDCWLAHACGNTFAGCETQQFFGGAVADHDHCRDELDLSTCHILNALKHDEPVYLCGDDEGPKPFRHGCSPIFGTCDYQPPVGQTTRPGRGEYCDTLCKQGLICGFHGTTFVCR